jgi:hypothetical protein
MKTLVSVFVCGLVPILPPRRRLAPMMIRGARATTVIFRVCRSSTARS